MFERSLRRGVLLALVVCLTAGSTPTRTDRLARRIGSMRLLYSGLTATLDPVRPVVPKNTRAGVAIRVLAGADSLPTADAERFFGGSFRVLGELAGPGLSGAVTLASDPADPLLLPIPALTISGDYSLSNVRVVVNDAPVLDVSPAQTTVQVIEQVLVTRVVTRPLTLDELKERGVVFDDDDFLAFDFTIRMLLESKPIDISFPVVFDRQGVHVPFPLSPLRDPARERVSLNFPPLPTIIPFMLEPDLSEFPGLALPALASEARIPSVLVIPGNVGFLKQFFSAQLFVANGAPGGSGLDVRDVTATIELPPGEDLVLGTTDDPLALPELTTGLQPVTLPVLSVGPDGEPGTDDDDALLSPGEQGQAEFLVRGEKEGFHTLAFDIGATLDGLVTGPIPVKGRASGGVLVRNPFFDMTFTVPSVVRAQEPFKLFVTVNNIGEGLANMVDVSFNANALSGLVLADEAPASLTIDTLLPGDSETLVFDFVAERTGKLVATYLRFDGEPAADGQLNFTLGVDERGVPLSPDTLVLPSSTDVLAPGLVLAAMRVLGQAWSVANAPSGTLPPDVTRIRQSAVIEKALGLAEAGLRIELGEEQASAIRGLAFDFYDGDPIDPGFDQLLHGTDAGKDFAKALANELETAVVVAGGMNAYEREAALIASSGNDFVSFAIGSTDVAATLTDATGATAPEISASIPLANAGGRLEFLLRPSASPYTLELSPLAAGPVDLSVTLPRGDGTFVRGSGSIELAGDAKARLVADLFAPENLVVELDTDDDGIFESATPLILETIVSQGPRLVAAAIVGPALLDGASPFGFHAAALYDRVVDENAGGDPSRYTIPQNVVKGAQRQLSGRVVFLTLEQPEGPYVEARLRVDAVTDLRGVSGGSAEVPLVSRLSEPGAIVTGRVFEADGAPVVEGTVGYANFRANDSCGNGLELLFAETPLRPDGSYELRYVRQDPCGGPFRMIYVSPRTGELRDVTGSVRAGGERIHLDIALFGRGAVTGIVRENGAPAPNANVVVVSTTDPQSGGVATTDGDGRYTVYDLVVGPISVKAARGIAAGANSGRIARAGTTTEVDVVLDPGKVRVSGVVSKLESGTTTTLPGVQVLYAIDVPNSIRPVPVGVTRTGADGSYVLEDMPFGSFQLTAVLTLDTRATVSGATLPGEDRVENLIIAIEPLTELGTIRGRVQLPDGSDAAGAVVRVGTRAVATDATGGFELPGLPVTPGVTQFLLVTSADGRRAGKASVVISTSGEIVDGLLLTLSGLGSVEFTVRHGNGDPVGNQLVGLIGGCPNLCGCRFATTDASGIASFSEVSAGTHFAKAVLVDGNFVDVGLGSARVEKDGDVGRARIDFAGAGSVTGTVFLPGGADPAVGAEVELVSQSFNRDVCELRRALSHRGRTDADGKFRFETVNVGRVSATAFHPFADKRIGDTKTLTSETSVDFTLELVDTTAGILSGTVFLPDGVTPAGAGIELTAVGALPEITVRTDDAGAYAFAPLFPQGIYIITVQDPVTGGLAQGRLFLRAEEDVLHDFRLKGRGTVLVRVVDAAGSPVENAFVKLTESDYPRGVFEAALEPANDGGVTFTNVFEGPFSVEAFDVFGRDGGRIPSVVPGPDASIELEIRLSAVGTVAGHFRLPDGSPIPFGVVKLLSGGQVIGQTTTLGAGDVGGFRFDFVPIGPVRLEAQDPLTSRLGFAAAELPAEGDTLTLDVAAQGLGRVEGVVTSVGTPQDGAHVDLVSGTFRACTTADENGFYFVEGVPEGVIFATASLGSGFLSGTGSDALIGDGTTLKLDVALRDSATVMGRVLAAGAGDAPGAPSLVTITVGGVGGARQTTTSDPADGSYRFERVPAGRATIDVAVLGSIDRARRFVDVLPGDMTEHDVSLNGVGAVRVQGRDESGNPTRGRLVVTGTGDFRYTFVVELADSSEVLFPEVLAGPVTATLRASGPVTLFGSASGVISPGEELLLPVDIEPSGIVRGGVRREDLNDAVGANVLLKLSGGRGTVTTQTNAEGTFEVQGVPLGDFDIRVEDPFTLGVGVLSGLTLSANGEILDGLVIDLDTSPVRVTSVEPPDGSVDLPLDSVVRIQFSDPVASFANAVFVREGAGVISTTKTLSPDGLTLTLEGTWPDARELTVEVTTGVVDILGRRPPSIFTSRFRTVDLSPPEVVAVTPGNLAIQVGVNTSISVLFDEPLGAATDLGALILLSSPAGALTGTTELIAPDTARFTPAAPLIDNVRYTVSVQGAVDTLGNQQTALFTTSFATPDLVAPSVVLTTPLPDAWTRSATPTISFTVSDNLSGMDPATIALNIDGEAVAPTSVTASAFSFVPASPLTEGPHTVLASVADRGGNVGSFSASFSVDSIAPSVAQLAGITEGQTLRGDVPVSASASDATSGVVRIDLQRDSGVLFLNLHAPELQGTLRSTLLSEGEHVLFARAVDVAGNIGPDSDPISVVVDNEVLSINITSPAATTPPLHFRDDVVVKATPSEAVTRIDFSVGSVTISDDTAPYEATLPLDTLPEGTVPITVTGFAVTGDLAEAVREIVVDRTPPLPPDVAVTSAEPPDNGVSLVFGRAGAVEAEAIVAATNTANGATGSVAAEPDGSFAMSLPADVDDVLLLTASDSLGNTSDPSTIVVRRTPSLPPSEGTTSLRFEGVIVDRVGPGLSALAPNGDLDAVFTVSLSIGDGITRELELIELEGTGPAGLKSTRPSAAATLGVAIDAGAPLLNDPDGQVAFPLTTGATLTLFADDNGFVHPGETYTVTAAFTDGARFVGRVTLTPEADVLQVPHSASIAATPSTVVTDGVTPATSTLVLTDLRDIEGVLVPDGAKVALAVADMASKDPRGSPLRSDGGRIVGGVPAANHGDFRIFTISSGEVVATYSSEPLVPAPIRGSHVVVQVLAADPDGNVLGSEAIATRGLYVRLDTDQAILTVTPETFYADKSDRRAIISVELRDSSGNPLPDGSKVLLSAASCASLIGNACVASKGGAILGGDASPSGAFYRAFTVANGRVEAEYTSLGIFAGVGDVETPNVQVLRANASGAPTSRSALAIVPIALVGASGAEIDLSPPSVPVVFPVRPVTVRVHHVHDARGNLVPDDATLLISPNSCATLVGNGCVPSSGGTILDGVPSPTGVGLKAFSLTLGEVFATYTAGNVTVAQGAVKTASIQIAMGDASGKRLDITAVAVATLPLVATTNAVGSATPPSLLADGALHLSTVVFDPVLDAFGNVVPDGSKVVASADSCASLVNNACVPSAGGQIVDGEPSLSGTRYKVFTVDNGAVTLTYGNQNEIAAPGKIARANVQLLAGKADGRFQHIGAIGVVPVDLPGLTSAESFASPASIVVDGSDRRATVTLSTFRDAVGQPVPDGTRIALSANSCAGISGNRCVNSVGGQIIGGATLGILASHFRVFTITNDQVVAEYSASGVNVRSGSRTAVVQVLVVRSNDTLLSTNVIATAPIQLHATPSTVVATSPMDLLGDASERLSQITIDQISEPGGTVVPDGAKLGLSAADCAATGFDGACLNSVGGEIQSAGTSPGDGDPAVNNPDYRVFTVAGGEVRAAYAATGIAAGVGETLEVNIAVVLADAAGNVAPESPLGFGMVHLHGTSSALADGPATLSLGDTATVSFTGIKDSAGNTVPDGAKVVVSAADCASVDDTSTCISSAGGAITDGEASPSGGGYRVFTVTGGSVTVTYSSAGAALGDARVQMAPARPDGTPIGNQSLTGGVWTVVITN